MKPSADEPVEKEVEAIARIGAAAKILETVCRTTGVGFAAVARVTESRWVALAVRDEINFGLAPGGELDLLTTICNEIRCSGEHVTIDHVDADPKWRDHPTPRRYGFQSYISVPIVLSDGSFFGTLCAIHPTPLALSETRTVDTFKLFAELLSMHIDAQRHSRRSEAALLSEREGALLREQFIAVLGHDLRNPLSAIVSGAEVLRRQPLPEQAQAIVALIRRSGNRMSALIRDVLDFARSRLGDGIQLHLSENASLAAALEQVVAELASAHPTRAITRSIDLPQGVVCDPERIAQMLSNLLGNAITHGKPDGPIVVIAHCINGHLELSVVNDGDPLPPHVQESLFQPFVRGSRHAGGQGLGLGLYIVAQIAQAHGGTIDVTSNDRQITFRFRMPVRHG